MELTFTVESDSDDFELSQKVLKVEIDDEHTHELARVLQIIGLGAWNFTRASASISGTRPNFPIATFWFEEY